MNKKTAIILFSAMVLIFLALSIFKGTAKDVELTIFKPDANAEYVVASKEAYSIDVKDTDMVAFIVNEAKTVDVQLAEYNLSKDGDSLILYFTDSLNNVAGSAGGYLFTGAIVESLFSYFPNLNEVTFKILDQEDAEMDHLLLNEPFVRGVDVFTAPTK